MRRWIFPEPVESAEILRFSQDLDLQRFAAELLVRRGLRSPSHAEQFLEPTLKSLSDPFLLPQMDLAVKRIFAALDHGERVVLYGDYDVDGVTSLTMLARVLRAFGGKPECFLPLRSDEGYGLSTDGLARCVGSHAPQLLIALDCGTSSV